MAARTTEPVRVVVVGTGESGLETARVITDAAGLRLAGGVFLGTGLLESARAVLGETARLTDDIDSIDADAAVVCGDPRFDRVAPTLRQLMLRNVPVVVDSGDMVWPWLRYPHLADAISNEANRAGVAVVGVGTDPALIATLLSALRACEGVTRVTVRRHTKLDAAHGRRIGVRRTAAQFRKLATEGVVGLRGLGETAVLVAQTLDRHPMRADVHAALRPALGPDGTVVGLEQSSAWSGGGLEVEVKEIVAADADPAGDAIEIEAGGRRTIAVPPGRGLVETLIGVARVLPATPPGLRTPMNA